MRSYSEEDKYDREELARLKAEPWMVECLRLNPSYTFWGPGEDYMSDGGDGWDASIRAEAWQTFEVKELDDLNEVVHFYFSVERDSEDCDSCGCSGYNPATRELSESFYSDQRRTGWRCDVTQDEVEALRSHHRLGVFRDGAWHDDPVTAEEVNAANRPGNPTYTVLGGFAHDSLNQYILVEARARRLGVWGKCERCGGHGYVFTAPAARLALTLWLLHPRKGCSRGAEVRSIGKDDLPSVYAYLREAARRNAERFSKVPGVTPVAA